MTSPPPVPPEIETLPLPPAYARKSQQSDRDLWDGPAEDEESDDEEMPFGRICLTVCMLFVGIAIMVYGVVEEVRSPMPAKGVPFWIIGILVLIPACYCTYELASLWRRTRPSAHHPIVEDQTF